MADADLPRCRSCWAVLRFITLTSGSKLPVNPVPGQGRATHAARKTPKGYVDGVVLRRGEPVPSGFVGFRLHKADCDMEPRAKAAVRTDPLF